MNPPRRRAARRSPTAVTLSVIVDEPLWRKHPPALRLIRHAARLAITSVKYSSAGKGDVGAPKRAPWGSSLRRRGLTLLLTSDQKLRVLNATFRGKNKPTNVLSFPTRGDAAFLGDIAMAYGVVARESRAQGKRFSHHAAHLAVHGTLHLLGYDHEKASQAKAMEALETELLVKLGIADPYASRPYTPRHA